jgi:signal transduction histidine kinase
LSLDAWERPGEDRAKDPREPECGSEAASLSSVGRVDNASLPEGLLSETQPHLLRFITISLLAALALELFGPITAETLRSRMIASLFSLVALIVLGTSATYFITRVSTDRRIRRIVILATWFFCLYGVMDIAVNLPALEFLSLRLRTSIYYDSTEKSTLLIGCFLFVAGLYLSIFEAETAKRTLAKERHDLALEVAERKRAEEALRTTGAKHRALLGAIPDLMFRIRQDGTLLDYMVPKGYEPAIDFAAFMNRDLHEALSPEVTQRLAQAVDQALHEGGVQVFEFQTSVNGELRDREARVIASGKDEALVIVRDVTHHKRLEREVLEISAREQRRIARDLHDGLGQDLTGVLCLSGGLAKKMEAESLPGAEYAAEIARLVKEAIVTTKTLAKGVRPVALDARGLAAALEELASSTEDLSGIECSFKHDELVSISDDAVAEHLYRIAQEAVHNAVRHAKAHHIRMTLATEGAKTILAICDDGVGIPKTLDKGKGMGLRIIEYRASMIEAALKIERVVSGGTLVSCSFSIPEKNSGGET